MGSLGIAGGLYVCWLVLDISKDVSSFFKRIFRHFWTYSKRLLQRKAVLSHAFDPKEPPPAEAKSRLGGELRRFRWRTSKICASVGPRVTPWGGVG